MSPQDNAPERRETNIIATSLGRQKTARAARVLVLCPDSVLSHRSPHSRELMRRLQLPPDHLSRWISDSLRCFALAELTGALPWALSVVGASHYRFLAGLEVDTDLL
jgi:hypothetical protein